MPSTVRLIELAIPMKDPFANAATSIDTRRVILVGLEDDGFVGWGEAAPYPGITTEGTDGVWTSLVEHAGEIGESVPGGLPPTAAAAVDQATTDLRARHLLIPLWEHIGGADRPVPATVAIGLQPDPPALAKRVSEAVAAGFRSVKLKIAPGRDLAEMAVVREEFGDLSLAVDANGSYDLAHPLWDHIDEFGLDYVEQPLPATRTDEHLLLRERFETPICLDESMHTAASARHAIETGAADIACLKPTMLGIWGLVDLAQAARDAGMRVKVSGLIETSIGRSHALALASLDSVAFADLVPPRWFLNNDVADPSWDLVDGTIHQNTGLGLGVDPDDVSLSGIIEREALIPIS